MAKISITTTIFFLIIIASLSSQTTENMAAIYPFAQEFDEERTIIRIFNTPAGYERFPSKAMTEFQIWLTNLPMLPPGRPVKDWQGTSIPTADSGLGILDMKIDKPYYDNISFPIFLYMHYFYLAGKLDKVRILMSKTDTLTYNNWLNGKYEYSQQDGFKFTLGTPRSSSQKEFQNYLDFVTKYFDDKTMELNTQKIREKLIRPGNMYIQFDKSSPSTITHVAMIIDVCRINKLQYKVLVAYGGNPAQSIVVPGTWMPTEKQWMSISELREYFKEFGQGGFYRYTN